MDPALLGLVAAVAAAVLGVGGALSAPALVEKYQRIKEGRARRRLIVENLKELRMASAETVASLETCLTDIFATGNFNLRTSEILSAAHDPIDDFGSTTISDMARKLQARIDNFVGALNGVKNTYAVLAVTRGGKQQLEAARAELNALLGEIQSHRRQLRDEIIQVSASLGNSLPPGLDATPL
jgi:uncharacterized phage infection (PIP) family protein YhgE